MDELRAFYRTEIETNAADLRRALEDVDAGGAEAIRRIAHQLKGSGASFGYPEITDRAAAVLAASPADLPAATRRLVATIEAAAREEEPEELVLVVEDDELIRRLLARTLEGAGYGMKAAGSLEEARTAVGDDVALILLDLSLPDGDGRELLREWRDRPPGTVPPVVVLSGLDAPAVRRECRELGAAAFVTKPFLPDDIRAAVETVLAAGGAEATAPFAAGGGTPRILLAEDDDLVASLIVDRLSRDGFELVRCRDGWSALAAAEEAAPDLAIVDVKMPKMDGFELLGRLRQLPELEELPVIVLTAMGGERDVLRGFELGAADYIVKPFSPTELAARVHRLVGR